MRPIFKPRLVGQAQSDLALVFAAINRPWPNNIESVDMNEPDGPVLFRDKRGNVIGFVARSEFDKVKAGR